MNDNNVINLENVRLLKEAGDAIEGIQRIVEEAMEHIDNPEVQKFIEETSKVMENLANEMEALNLDIEKYNKECDGTAEEKT